LPLIFLYRSSHSVPPKTTDLHRFPLDHRSFPSAVASSPSVSINAGVHQANSSSRSPPPPAWETPSSDQPPEHSISEADRPSIFSFNRPQHRRPLPTAPIFPSATASPLIAEHPNSSEGRPSTPASSEHHNSSSRSPSPPVASLQQRPQICPPATTPIRRRPQKPAAAHLPPAAHRDTLTSEPSATCRREEQKTKRRRQESRSKRGGRTETLLAFSFFLQMTVVVTAGRKRKGRRG